MRPLGILIIGITIFILNLIHFLIVSGDFFLNANGPTDPRTDPRTDIRTDTPSYRDATAHRKTEPKLVHGFNDSFLFVSYLNCFSRFSFRSNFFSLPPFSILPTHVSLSFFFPGGPFAGSIFQGLSSSARAHRPAEGRIS